MENMKYMLSLICSPHIYRSSISSSQSTELVGYIHFNASTVWMIPFLWSLCRWPSAAYVNIYCIMAKKLKRNKSWYLYLFILLHWRTVMFSALVMGNKGLSISPKVWMTSSSRMKRHMVRWSWRKGWLIGHKRCCFKATFFDFLTNYSHN